jgi:hypothetical protein
VRLVPRAILQPRTPVHLFGLTRLRLHNDIELLAIYNILVEKSIFINKINSSKLYKMK